MNIANPRRKVATLIGFTVGAVVVFLFLFRTTGATLNPFASPYTASAIISEPLNLVANADVRLDGVIIGKVQKTGNRGAMGYATFTLDSEHAPIYRDATYSLRILTLVGETYIDLDPGTAQSGVMASGGTIPQEQAEEVVPLEKLLDTLGPNTRTDVRENVQSIGGALQGRGLQLNRLLESAEPTVAEGSELMSALRDQRGQLATAVDDTAEVLQALADRTNDVRTLAVQAKATAEAVTSRDEALRRTFRELPPTLAKARGSVNKLASFSGRAVPVLTDLRLAAGDLGPTLVDLRTAASAGRTLFDELPGFVDRADPLLAELTPFSRELRPAVSSADALLREANPALTYLSDYDRDIASYFALEHGVNNTRDAIGNLGRVMAIGGPQSFTNPEANRAYDALVESGFAFNPSQDEQANSYPRPGTIGDPGEPENYRRLEADR